MNITLRQAHKLVNKIQGKLATVNITVTKELNIWEIADATVTYTDAVNKLNLDINRSMKLREARHEIRKNVQAANAEVINGLIADRFAAIDAIGVLRNIIAAARSRGVIGSASALELKVASMRETPSSGGRYSGGDTIEVSLVTDADIMSLERQVNESQLQIEQLDEKLAQANTNTVIALSDETIAILKHEGLI